MAQEGAENRQLRELRRDVDETAGLMRDNIEKVLDRGEKLDVLQERAENLEEESKTFEVSAKKVKKKMWWKSKKWTAIIVAVVLAVIIIIILAIVLSIKPWKK